MFRDVLKEARRRKGLTQEQVAREIGSSLATYLRWERGVGHPSFRYSQKLQEVFGSLLSDIEVLSTATSDKPSKKREAV